MKTMPSDPLMSEEYDFSKGVRGKYAKRNKEGTNVVVIDVDVTQYFPDHATGNDAIRSLLPIVKAQAKRILEKSE